MTDAKFTPGPWRRRERGSPHLDVVADCMGDDNPLITVHPSGCQGRAAERHDEAIACLHLVIAGPDLYEALKDCALRLRRAAELGGNARYAVEALCAQYEAVLAKARGE